MATSKEEVLTKFVEWFDANSVGDKFDGFIRENAGDFVGASSDGEQELSRMMLYKRYCTIFDELLQAFVTHAGITQAEFLEAARSADGLHDAYLNIFLAHAEYDVRRPPAPPGARGALTSDGRAQVFIELMAEEASKQEARS